MRGLHTAGVLLTPALAGAISLEDSIPRAFINIHVPDTIDSTPDLVLRFDVNESQDTCGYGNVTINGQNLLEDGHGPLNVGDHMIDASWNFTCVTWNDRPQEQLLSLNVENVNGQAVDIGFTLRFQQVAPVWISDIEGSASMTRVHSNHYSQSEPDDDKEIDLDAELAELDYLHWQIAELAHLLHAKEQHLAEVFGWERPLHWPAPRIHECDSLKCVIEAIAYTVKGAASSFYGGGRPGPHGPHGPGHHRHGPGGDHHRGPHHDFGKPGHEKPGHGNHTDNGTHPYPPPPHGKKPHFPHPPPFCKCAPLPPPHHGDRPPPPPPPHHGAYPPPPPPPPHGDFPPPPPGPGFGPPPPHHGSPGFWESLFGFIHPHGPPPPMPWEQPDWEHPALNDHHGHGHKGGPHVSHDDHPGQADEDRQKEHSQQNSKEPNRLDDHKPSDDFNQPETKGEEHETGSKNDLERPENSRPSRPGPEEHHHADMPWETELRRGHDNRPPPHDGPHEHEEFRGHHPPPPGPPPPGPPPPGPPPPPGHHPHGPPPPPHGPVFIHIASGIASLVLIVVFSSVLYQRYVRKSIRSPRRHRRNSNAPWYKRLCFGPNYSELSEDEEKEAMLRNCGDSDSEDDSEDDSNVIARDISQFRTAADMVGEMVAVEEARMVTHSRQPSFSHMPAPAPATIPVQQQQQQQQQQQHMLQQHQQPQHMHPYMPTHLIPTNNMPMPMPTGQLSPDPATMAAMAAMFPDLAADYDLGDHAHHGVGTVVPGEELPAYQEADRQSDSDESEFASSMVTDGYRPGCSGSYTPSESGSQGASDILGDTKN